jgi:hypothetical protein
MRTIVTEDVATLSLCITLDGRVVHLPLLWFFLYPGGVRRTGAGPQQQMIRVDQLE